MRRRRRKSSRVFWLIVFSVLGASLLWVLIYEPDIEVKDVDYAHYVNRSEISFEIRNNTSDKKKVGILLIAEIHRKAKTSVGTQRVGFRKIVSDLYPKETRGFEDVLVYEPGIKFVGSIISVEVFEIESAMQFESLDARLAVQ